MADTPTAAQDVRPGMVVTRESVVATVLFRSDGSVQIGYTDGSADAKPADATVTVKTD